MKRSTTALLCTAIALAAPAGAGAATGSRLWSSSGCGDCHTLAAAGSSGSEGPNLDQLRPSQSAVAAQVTGGGPGMPSFGGSLSAAEIDALAAWVSSAAGGSQTAAGGAALPPPAQWVRRLQRDLAKLGYFHHAVTGVYGPITTAAVKRFQASAGLTRDGLWGPKSQAALVARLRSPGG